MNFNLKPKPTTVDAALAPLMTAIADLEQVNVDRLLSASDKEVDARQLQAEAEVDRTEATRAQSVLTKLRNLTGE